jgi:mannose-1-phosphate guanylyltransferase/mannose-1-phosphate guanylyltransferase/mannose-6-phosphate isomerase
VLSGNESLFQLAARRLAALAAPEFSLGAPCIVGNDEHRFLVLDQLRETGLEPSSVLLEPLGRNTAPALTLAALAALEGGQDPVLVVTPADQTVTHPAAFTAALQAAVREAAGGGITILGITPDRPETGYGYLQRGTPLAGGFAIRRFVEKPDRAHAERYLASGDYSWNGGIFAFRAGHLLAELAAHRPDMARLVAEAVAGGRDEGNRFHPAPEPFAAIDGDSIDYAVMENTAAAAMVPADMGWSDIGNWAALADALAETADDAGNVARVRGGGGSVDLADCAGVFAMTDGPRISAVGLKDVCIIVSGGEVLVTTRDGAQAVGKLPGAANQ